MDKLNHFKECYLFEHARRESLYSHYPLPVSILSILAGLMGFYGRSFTYQNIYFAIPFGILFIACLYYLIMAIIALYFSMIGTKKVNNKSGKRSIFRYDFYTMGHIGSSDKWLTFLNKDLNRYYTDNSNKINKAEIVILAENQFENELIKMYSYHASCNYMINNIRHGHLADSLKRLFIAVLFLGASVPFFVLDSFYKDETIIKVKITNIDEASTVIKYFKGD